MSARVVSAFLAVCNLSTASASIRVNRYLSPFTSSVSVVTLALRLFIFASFSKMMASFDFSSCERLLLLSRIMRKLCPNDVAVGSPLHRNPDALIKLLMVSLTPALYDSLSLVASSFLYLPGWNILARNPDCAVFSSFCATSFCCVMMAVSASIFSFSFSASTIANLACRSASRTTLFLCLRPRFSSSDNSL